MKKIKYHLVENIIITSIIFLLSLFLSFIFCRYVRNSLSIAKYFDYSEGLYSYNYNSEKYYNDSNVAKYDYYYSNENDGSIVIVLNSLAKQKGIYVYYDDMLFHLNSNLTNLELDKIYNNDSNKICENINSNTSLIKSKIIISQVLISDSYFFANQPKLSICTSYKKDVLSGYSFFGDNYFIATNEVILEHSMNLISNRLHLFIISSVVPFVLITFSILLICFISITRNNEELVIERLFYSSKRSVFKSIFISDLLKCIISFLISITFVNLIFKIPFSYCLLYLIVNYLIITVCLCIFICRYINKYQFRLGEIYD